MIPKKVFNPRSRQHWFGVALGIAGGLLSTLPSVREFIPEQAYGLAFVALSVAVIVLRNITKTPIDQR